MAEQIVIYFTLITTTIVIQAFSNKIMDSVSSILRDKYSTRTVLLVLLLYITFLTLLIDILLWASVIYLLGIYGEFRLAMAYAIDSFSTLGGKNLPPPWELLGPTIALNGIVIIAFGATYMFSTLYPEKS